MDFTAEFQRLLASEDAVVVSIAATQGSAPREAGTWMAVFARHIVGTIGGGHVEFEAIAEARALLIGSDTSNPPSPQSSSQPASSFPRRRESTSAYEKRYVLGPSLGQCCGGVMVLQYEIIHYEKHSYSGNEYAGYTLKIPQKSLLQPIALFGGGHVGKAIVNILATLPLQVMWIDSRDEIFPADIPENVVCEHSAPVQAAVADLPPNSRVLIMSFSHAEDLDILAACLKRQREKSDLPFIGLIGSKTKWATFRNRLSERGFAEAELAQVTCPIGIEGIKGKEPEVIAVAVAAQLLKMN